MEEDIQNFSPTVMFRGTPCMIEKTNTVNMKVFLRNKSGYKVYVPIN